MFYASFCKKEAVKSISTFELVNLLDQPLTSEAQNNLTDLKPIKTKFNHRYFFRTLKNLILEKINVIKSTLL